ncbi:MAG: BMP family ABC transporter substrate-binding protein [Alphaproteobacteria bacterium]|nr:BMP family ABC transporter substrate-binding protein [Alphaproteobacteria bacterium]
MSIFKKAIAVGALLSMSTTAFAADLKVGFVYVGDTGDGGWTYQHEQGRIAVQEKFGDAVETISVEKVAEGPDAERIITRMARQGVNLIFTTSFGYMDPTINVAKKFPDVKFEHATGYKQAENVSSYSARFYEGRYIIGQIAANESKTGVAGYIGSFPIPEVVRGINAFMLGAQSVNPDFKLKVIWVNSWYDPGKEADAVKVFAAQGVDIITQHTDSTAPMQIAEEKGLKAFGQASDMAKFGPTAQMTAIVDDWAPYYIERVQAVIDGTWKSVNTWDGIKQGMVHMTEFKNMKPETAAMAEATKEAIRSGALVPFAGPITNQAGEIAVKAGESLDDGALAGMDWYVQGVETN